jgi:alkaline phosphatase
MFHVFSGYFLAIVCLLGLVNHPAHAGRTEWSVERNPAFWRDQARSSIDEQLKRRDNTKVAKNVIIFLGDGMGLTTVTAGRIRKGQMKGELGEDFLTEMEQMDHLGLAKTYASMR